MYYNNDRKHEMLTKQGHHLKKAKFQKPRWWPQQNAKTLRTYEDLSSSDVDKIDQYIAQEGAFDGEEHDLEEIAVFTGDTETGNSIQNWASLVNRYLRSNNKWGKKKEIKTTQPPKSKSPKSTELCERSQLKAETNASEYAQQKCNQCFFKP